MANTLAPNTELGIDQSIQSINLQYSLVMQGDGNLVIYRGGQATWDARTTGQNGVRAVMQDDGNFVIYTAANTPVWDSQTQVAHSRLAMQDDGNLVIYSPADVPVWDSGAHPSMVAAPPITPIVNDATLTTNVVGIVLTLSHNATQQVITTIQTGQQYTNLIIQLLTANGAAIPPQFTAALTLFGLFLPIGIRLIRALDTGNGIYLTLPWAAIIFSNFTAIVPGPRP